MKNRLNTSALILLSLGLSSSANPILGLQNPYGNAYPKTFLGFDVYNTGSWPFLTCTPDQGAKLTQLWSDVGNLIDNKMIPDMRLGAASTHGYFTMFSHNDPSQPIAVMQDGSAHRGYSTLNTSKLQPDLAVFCINDLPDPTNVVERHVKDAMAQVKAECDRLGTEYYTSPGMDIWMCPKYFTTYKARNLPTDTSSCPKTDPSSTRFASLGGIDGFNGFNILYTLGRKYAPIYQFPKVDHINLCFILKPEKQLSNGHNYAFYGSCKWQYP